MHNKYKGAYVESVEVREILRKHNIVACGNLGFKHTVTSLTLLIHSLIFSTIGYLQSQNISNFKPADIKCSKIVVFESCAAIDHYKTYDA